MNSEQEQEQEQARADLISKIILRTVTHKDFYAYSPYWAEITRLLFKSEVLNKFNMNSEINRVRSGDVLENFIILFGKQTYLDFRVMSTQSMDTYEVTIMTLS